MELQVPIHIPSHSIVMFVTKIGNSRPLIVFFRLFKLTLQFFYKCKWKIVHPVYGAGIWTHDLPYPQLVSLIDWRNGLLAESFNTQVKKDKIVWWGARDRNQDGRNLIHIRQPGVLSYFLRRWACHHRRWPFLRRCRLHRRQILPTWRQIRRRKFKNGLIKLVRKSFLRKWFLANL